MKMSDNGLPPVAMAHPSQFDWTSRPYREEDLCADVGHLAALEAKAAEVIDRLDTELPPPITVIDPAHYRQHPSGIECIEITQHMNFCIGSAVGYLWRAGLKPGAAVEDDLRKAKRFIEFELKRLGFE